MCGLVLSLFPGADLFGMAFEQQGFCVVRGPDILLGGDIKKWHCIKGKFDGVIGGPPCQLFSKAHTLSSKTRHNEPLNLIPEFERIIEEAAPKWWVMENVTNAPIPKSAIWSANLDAYEFGSKQHRKRKFSSNLQLNPLKLDKSLLFPNPFPTVTATEHKCGNGKNLARAGRKVGRRLTIEEINELMGLPKNFQTPCLKIADQYRVRGNGVPIEMGVAIAKAVKELINTIQISKTVMVWA